MGLNCLETEAEKASDFPVSVTFGDQFDDLALSRRELRLCLGSLLRKDSSSVLETLVVKKGLCVVKVSMASSK